jgi:hypothetical protein
MLVRETRFNLIGLDMVRFPTAYEKMSLIYMPGRLETSILYCKSVFALKPECVLPPALPVHRTRNVL